MADRWQLYGLDVAYKFEDVHGRSHHAEITGRTKVGQPFEWESSGDEAKDRAALLKIAGIGTSDEDLFGVEMGIERIWFSLNGQVCSSDVPLYVMERTAL